MRWTLGATARRHGDCVCVSEREGERGGEREEEEEEGMLNGHSWRISRARRCSQFAGIAVSVYGAPCSLPVSVYGAPYRVLESSVGPGEGARLKEDASGKEHREPNRRRRGWR